MRKWDPHVAKEEKIKKKRQREDNHVKEFHPEDRPILLIKNKHVYKNVKQDDVFATTDDKEDYYKLTERADVIDDVGEEVQAQEAFIKRKTVVHKPKSESFKDSQDPNMVYKIEGIEFLPEGFIELDPLLFKDEFDFDNKVMENLFREDQLRTKQLRRKQYEERNLQKMRNVTIYVLDEKKAQIIEYLEKWYFKNKRRMNEDELRYVAELMKTDVNSMAQLQDYYLKRKQLTNTRLIKEYLRKNGKLEQDKLNVPDSLKKYFIKQQNQYDNVEPRVMNEKQGYNPVFLDKHKKYFKRPKSSNRKPGLYSRTAEMDRTLKKFGKEEKAGKSDINEVMDFNHLSASLDMIANKASVNVNKTAQANVNQRSEASPDDKAYKTQQEIGNDQDMRLYYDSEINKILSKIKGYKAVYKDNDPRINPNECDVDINNTKGLMNCEEVLKKDPHGSQKYVDSFKQRVLGNESREAEEKKKKVSMTSKMEKYDKNSEYKEWAYTELNNNAEVYDIKAKTSVSKKSSKLSQVVQKHSLGKKMGITDVVKLKRIGKLMSKGKLRAEGSIDKKELTTDEMIVEPLELPKRVTIISRNDKGESVIVQKLRPTLVGNEYYYQTINECIDANGKRKITLMTKDGEGNTIDETEIADDYIGQLYDNALFINEDAKTKDRKITLAVYNEKGETVGAVQQDCKDNEIDRKKSAYKEIINENNETMNCIQETKRKSTLSRVSKLRPSLVGNQYYHQIVEEYINNHGKRQLTVKTFNEQGKCLATNPIEDHLAADAYYSLVINENIDELGNRKATLLTITDKNVTILSQTISPKIKDKLVNDYYNDLYEEIFDASDNRKVSVIYKPSDKKEMIVVNEILPRETFNLEEIIKNTSQEEDEEEEGDNNRKPTLKGKGRSKTEFNESRVSKGERKTTDVKGMVPLPQKRSKTIANGESYYKGMIDDLIQKVGKSKKSTKPTPVLLANQYYNDLLYDLGERKKKLAPNQRFSEYKKPKTVTVKGKSKTMHVKQRSKGNTIDFDEKNATEILVSPRNELDDSFMLANPEIREKVATFAEADDNKKERVEIYNKSLKKIPFSGYKADKLSLALPKNFTDKRAKAYTYNPNERNTIDVKALDPDQFKKKPSKKVKTSKKNTVSSGYGKQKDSLVNRLNQRTSPKNRQTQPVGHYKRSEDRGKANTMHPKQKVQFEERVVEKRHSEHPGGVRVSEVYNQRRSQAIKDHMDGYDESELKKKISEVLEKREGIDREITDELARKLDTDANQDLMDEFFEYCKNYLPSDFRYKESVLFVTLFYYFMKKENLVN